MIFLRSLLLFSCWLVSMSAAQAACMDAFVGERLEYEMGWEFIMAGTATLRAFRDSAGHHQQVEARTNKFFDMFKKVRDFIEGDGRCDAQGRWRSLRFHVKQRERSYRAEKLSEFSADGRSVRYTQNGKTDVYPVTPAHIHVLDAFYKVRGMPLKPGDHFRVPVFDSRKSYDLIVDVLPRTVKLMAPWGKTERCIIVRPTLKTAGLFSSRGKIKVWMTDDARHIPLRMSAKIKIGRIMGYLTHYTPPPQGTRP